MFGEPFNYKNMKPSKIKIESEKKQTEYLYQMNDMLQQADSYLSQFSINRYLETTLVNLDLNKTSFKEWFKKENLLIKENKLIALYRDKVTSKEYLAFVSTLTDKEITNSSDCVEILAFIFFYEHDRYFNEKYSETFKNIGFSNDFMCKQEEYTISKTTNKSNSLEMPLGDQTKLSDFINIVRVLNAKTFINKNIDLLNKFEYEIYNIGEFIYRSFGVGQ